MPASNLCYHLGEMFYGSNILYLIEVDRCCDRSSLTYPFIATNRNEPACAICYQVIIKLYHFLTNKYNICFGIIKCHSWSIPSKENESLVPVESAFSTMDFTIIVY